MSEDLAMMPACGLLERYRCARLSPVEVTEAVLARIDRLEPLLNSYAFLDRESALRSARESEQRWHRKSPCGPLDGVPLSLKDLVLTRDMPTGRGSLAIPPDPGSEDAPVAARLREAGAVILGKTTTSEFGWKGVADCPATGITRNPWDPARTPGASSGGAVAGLAAGLATLASGSDGGGSIRIPAAFTGVYGLKPTYGQVPQYPPSQVGTVSHIGPLARTVGDAALLYSVMAQPDPRDWYASPSPQAVAPADLEGGVRGLRIAYSPDLGYAEVDPEIATLVSKAAAVFSELGADVEATQAVFDCPLEIYRVHFLAAFAQFARKLTAEQRARLDPGLNAVMEAGRSVTLADYLDAVARRERLGIETSLFHTRYDLLLTPTLPIAAFEVGRESPWESRSCPTWLDWNPFTYPFNLTQQPAASVPCGLTAGGLPVGLQIVGAKGADALVLRASRAFEMTRPFPALPVERLLAQAAAKAGDSA